MARDATLLHTTLKPSFTTIKIQFSPTPEDQPRHTRLSVVSDISLVVTEEATGDRILYPLFTNTLASDRTSRRLKQVRLCGF